MTEKLLVYAVGRGLDHHDQPAVRAIARKASAAHYRFSELIIDHASGAVAKDEWITDAGDLKAAQMQAAAMAKAKVTLDVAADNAVKGNAGYRAVSVMPTCTRPVQPSRKRRIVALA